MFLPPHRPHNVGKSGEVVTLDDERMGLEERPTADSKSRSDSTAKAITLLLGPFERIRPQPKVGTIASRTSR
jgi:hypothetical protein